MNQSMFSIACTNSFEVKPQFNRHFDSKSYRVLLNAMILFWDTSFCKHHTWHIVENLLNFFTIASTYDIMGSWQISWFSDFVCFFYNLKVRWPHVRGRVSWTRCLKFLFISRVRPRTGLYNMNIIFYSFYSIIWITYSSNLTYTKKILWKTIN